MKCEYCGHGRNLYVADGKIFCKKCRKLHSRRCTATAKWTGQQCRRHTLSPTGLCNEHREGDV
jgi:hypothetical protein